MESRPNNYGAAVSGNSRLPEHQPLPKVRRELVAYAQIYDGQPYWVVKDPVSLRYYRFNREEYFIIEQLRGDITLAQLKTAHRKEFHTDCLQNEDVAQFVRVLTSKGIITMTQPDRDETLYRLSKQRWWLKTKALFKNFLFVKVPVFDPDKILTKLWHYFRFVWTWPAFMLYLLLIAVAIGMVHARWDDFMGMFHTRFFTIYNVPLLMISIWLIKALHEFGHGLTCKNYGGEVHEMGWLFLIFVPFFYCNVTDSWTLANKRHRIFVTASGIMTELIFASLGAVVWYYTKNPDFIHLMAFNIVVMCSFQTILFNANPLMKFDGYYVLMDLMEVPNLRQRASIFMRNVFIRYILGGEPEETAEEHRFRAVFPIYSVAAYLYRWVVVIGIMFGLSKMLEKLHLAWLGRGLVVFAVFSMLLMPLLQGGKMIASRRHALGISNVRLVILLAIIVGAAGFGLFWPMEQHVTLNFILEPGRVQLVRTAVDGELQLADIVQSGAYLTVNGDDAGPIVAEQTNLDLGQQIVSAEAEIRQLDIEIDQRLRYGQEAEVEILRQRRASTVSHLEQLRTFQDQLEVHAGFSGEVLATVDELDQLDYRFVRRGVPLFIYADTSEMNAKVWVSESNLARIFHDSQQTGQEAELMLYAFPGRTFSGNVVTMPGEHCEDSMGEFSEKLALSHKAGGEVYTVHDYETNRERPRDPVYEITIDLADAEVLRLARPYMSGRVQISCGRFTLYQWARDSLLRYMSPDVRL